jgi:Tfp pilus assembly protein PilO
MKSMYRGYVKAGVFLWAACFIGFFLFYLIALGPQEKFRRQSESKLAEVQRLAQTATDAADKQNKTRLTEQVREAEQTLQRFVTAEKSIDNLTLDIREIPSRAALNAFSISTGSSESDLKIDNCEHIVGQQLSVSFTSSFNQFATFLNALEMSRPVVFIDAFSVARSKQGAPSKQQVDMTLAVLVSKEAQTKEASRS